MIQLQTLGGIVVRNHSGAEITGIPPKRLGLLLYLALATPSGYHRRDRLTSLFWPNSDSAKGRAGLSRAIYDLRSALGQDVVVTRGDQDVGVDFRQLDCDVVQFEQLVRAHEYRRALDLWKGELLPGFHVADAAHELDQWLDERRAHLRAAAGDAAWRLAEQAAEQNHYVDAARYAQRSLTFHPGNETWLRRVMQLLDRVGDRAAAAGVYREFAANLEAAFELEPSPETQELLATIHARNPQRRIATKPVAPRVDEEIRKGKHPSPALLAVAAVIGLLTVTWLTLEVVAARNTPARLIAVGTIRVAHDSLNGFNTLLTTNLARIEDVDVVSETRLLELASAAGNDLSRAARQAGATVLIEGTLSQHESGLRLDLREIDTRTGRIDAAFTITERDIYRLVDVAVERLARALEVGAPADRLEGRTTSIVAYRFYEEGLRALYKADNAAAEGFFRLALQEDSAFAMAAWHLSLLDDFDAMRALANRLAQYSHDRERLTIQAAYALAVSAPNGLAIAETLATRFPHEPDANIAYANALMQAGRPALAIPYAERVLASDTALIKTAARCRACDAFGILGQVYTALDSPAALLRVAHARHRLQPDSYAAWLQLADAYTKNGRFDATIAALDSSGHLAADRFAHLGYYSDIWMRRGEFEKIDHFWQEMLRAPDVERQEEALWVLTKSYREQGRLQDAMASARAFRIQRNKRIHEKNVEPLFDPTWGDRLNEAIVLMEMGKPREAAALFEKIATQDRRAINSHLARSRAWYFNHAASAYAQAGDTAQLRILYDSVRVNAERQSSNTMRQLPHYVRGLRLSRAGKHAEALAELLRAPPMRRVQFERARCYIAMGRPRDAIRELRQAIASAHHHYGLYLTQGDAQELLGHAYELAGQPDSALVTYRQVYKAWQNADRTFDARKRALAARIARLE